MGQSPLKGSKATNVPPYIRHGSSGFWRTNLALFAAGFCNFSMLYDVQPLMPEFSKTFHVNAVDASLSLSLTTGLLAFAMLVGGAVSDTYGRKPIMLVSLLFSSILTLVLSFTPSWHALLSLRALMGLTLCGIPAVAMAYVSEEMHPQSVGLAMGLYIGGNALGGMSGRLITGVLADFYPWHIGITVIGVLGMIGTFILWRALPRSRHFRAHSLHPRQLAMSFTELFRDRGLPWFFLEGFLLMGSFVTVYNYISYRLLAPPYELRQALVGLIYAVYIIGIFSSTFMGHLADRLGRRRVLWSAFTLVLVGLALTMAHPLAIVILGVAVVTFGFFAGHSIVASWVGQRVTRHQAQASSLYLFAYYLGSALAGTSGGFFWTSSGWIGVVLFSGTLSTLGLILALYLFRLEPHRSSLAAQ